ncbi:hypothetical protein AK812_SmicGene46433, partial [Symbiodinium microadriaticum]
STRPHPPPHRSARRRMGAPTWRFMRSYPWAY